VVKTGEVNEAISSIRQRNRATLNVYTQVMDDSLRTAVDRVGKELFTVVHSEPGALEPHSQIS
jgi:hypothetical protein